MSRPIDVAEYVDGVRAGNRTMLGRAITLVESTKPDHQERAQEMLVKLLPFAGDAHRVGITGVPGAGKSTFIDALGTKLTRGGHRIAVLATDPTSSRTGGSILGDKTRMHQLAVDPSAFIRPSPTSGTLGGVTRATRESIIVCEAAGFDVVLVETVGVGQSETLVANMVDFFLVLMIPGAGDELQGIKRGVLELADMVAVNKADGDNMARARIAVREYTSALRLMRPASPSWSPPVVLCSALTGSGLDALWAQIELHRATLAGSGELAAKRQAQQVSWMWAMVEERLLLNLRTAPAVRKLLPKVEREVRDGALTATLAAQRILDAFE